MLGFILLSRRRAESITGPPAKVTTTSPVNGAVNQQLDITITWLRPSQAQSYIVYFGTESGNLGDAVQTSSARSYVPLNLILDETYYFRIDSVNSLGTTTGDEFSFSTWSINDIWTMDDGTPVTTDAGEYIEITK